MGHAALSNEESPRSQERKKQQQNLPMEAKVQSEQPSAVQKLRGTSILNDFTNKVFK